VVWQSVLKRTRRSGGRGPAEGEDLTREVSGVFEDMVSNYATEIYEEI
jgi:hypothetical protein